MLENLGQILPTSARMYGDKTALVFKEGKFSFNDLFELSGRLANSLSWLGVQPGARVTLYSQNCWEWIVSYYAVARLGAVINPINVMLTPEEVLYVVKDCGAKIVLSSADKGQALLSIKGDSQLQEIILFSENVPKGARSFNEMLRHSRPEFGHVNVAAESLSTIGYTSGTTG